MAEDYASSSFFLTGMQRSGTTLLEKLLDSHPKISALSQPFPYLFIELKRHFLESLGVADERYPLGPLFRETRYGPTDFRNFLGEFRLDAAKVRGIFHTMAEFSGQYTRVSPDRLERVLDRLEPGELAVVIEHLYRELSDSPSASRFGGKETVCEEFLPYLLDSGVRGVIIVRDARDVLTSLNHGKGRQFGGTPKPTLFNVRSWRRSVAFALHLTDHERFAWLRYEDLVSDPVATLSRITDLLNVSSLPKELFRSRLRDQAGNIWTGNSSHSVHSGITRSSVGAFKTRLPDSVRRFTEATCFPELTALGYPTSVHPEEIPRIIRDFKEPYSIDRAELLRYIEDPSELDAEIQRFRVLTDDAVPIIRELVLFTDVGERLREAFGRSGLST